MYWSCRQLRKEGDDLMPLDLKEQLYKGDNVVWVTTSNRPLTPIEKRLREEAEKKLEEDAINDIFNSIKVYEDKDPYWCVIRYLFDYNDKNGYQARSMAQVSAYNIDRFGHGIIQEYINCRKREFARKIYNDIMTKKKEKSNMFKEFMDDIRDIGGEISFGFESNMYVEDEAEITIRIPTKCLPMLKVQKTETKKNQEWIEGLPAIEKIETYNNRVVKVTYIDGTFTKAVCSENDTFDLDVGITICAMKRLFGENGTRMYNNYISHAHKVMEKNDKEKLVANVQKMIEKAKKRKAEIKRVAKKMKKKEEQIDIFKQAIIRARQEEGLV